MLCNQDLIKTMLYSEELYFKNIDKIQNNTRIIGTIILNINKIIYLINYEKSKILGNAQKVPRASNIITIINEIKEIINSVNPN